MFWCQNWYFKPSAWRNLKYTDMSSRHSVTHSFHFLTWLLTPCIFRLKAGEKGNKLSSGMGKCASYLEKNIAVPVKRYHLWSCSEGCSALEGCCKSCVVCFCSGLFITNSLKKTWFVFYIVKTFKVHLFKKKINGRYFMYVKSKKFQCLETVNSGQLWCRNYFRIAILTLLQ